MAGGFDPGMVEGNVAAFAGDFLQRHEFGAFAARGDHDAEGSLVDGVRARGPEPRGEEAVHGGGRAAALDVAEDGDAGFEVGEFLKLMREAQGVAAVARLEFGEGGLGLLFFVLGFGLFAFVERGAEGGRDFSVMPRPRRRRRC